MSFYLDTSAIRQFGGQLPILAKKYPLKASVLGQIEIISRAGDASHFGRCKSQIRHLVDSRITIDQDMPDKLLLWGFEYVIKRVNFEEFRVPCLAKLVELLMQSNELEEFKKREESLKLRHPLAYFEHYDEKFGELFDGTFDEDTKKIKTAFEMVQRGEAEAPIVPPEIIKKGFVSFCEWFMEEQADLNYSATVMGLAQRAADDIPGDHVVEEIYATYNSATSAFAEAMSRLTMFTHINGGRPGRNDALDLAHFLYIREGDLLITNDKKMSGLAEKIGCPVKKPEALLPR